MTKLEDINDYSACYFFTAEDGVFGEACNGVGSGPVDQVVWRDGRPHEDALKNTTFCALVTETGRTFIGQHSSSSAVGRHYARSLAFADAKKQIPPGWPAWQTLH